MQLEVADDVPSDAYLSSRFRFDDIGCFHPVQVDAHSLVALGSAAEDLRLRVRRAVPVTEQQRACGVGNSIGCPRVALPGSSPPAGPLSSG